MSLSAFAKKAVRKKLRLAAYLSLAMCAKRRRLSYHLFFEDSDYVIVDKTSGVLSVADRTNKSPHLLGLLNDRFGHILPVHRLDRDTSGLMLFARNKEAQKAASELFENRNIQKHYLALVDGRPEIEEGLVDVPIAPSSQSSKMLVKPNGKDSQTQYRILEELGRFTLIECKLLTGRTHQIRVHMQYIGHPLAVDPIYGQRDGLYLSEIKKHYNLGKEQDEQPLLGRLSLHASKLAFVHPFTEKEVSFESELPKDMRAICNQLRKLKAKI